MADNKTKVTEHNQRLLSVLENMNNAQANKANTDASNLSEENVEAWKSKLGVGEGGTKVIFEYYD